jgi:hypothetical protein
LQGPIAAERKASLATAAARAASQTEYGSGASGDRKSVHTHSPNEETEMCVSQESAELPQENEESSEKSPQPA